MTSRIEERRAGFFNLFAVHLADTPRVGPAFPFLDRVQLANEVPKGGVGGGSNFLSATLREMALFGDPQLMPLCWNDLFQPACGTPSPHGPSENPSGTVDR